jgi:hypothetical protein
MVGIRADILAGDLRSLYLGWLLGVQGDVLDDDELEPVLPPGCPGLGEPSGPLDALAEFLRIDPDLVAAAAEGMPAGDPEQTRSALQAWLAALPGAEKDALLLRVADGEGPAARGELLKRFRDGRAASLAATVRDRRRRTVGELRERARALSEERERREAEKGAREAARRAEADACARKKHLDALMGSEAELWRRVETLIRATQPRQYDAAVALLADLRDLARREGTEGDFRPRLADLRERHRNKPSLRERLDRAGL